MIKYAVRNNGVIVDWVGNSPSSYSDQNPIDESSQEWLDYQDRVFTQIKADKLAEINNACDAAMADILNDYPAVERQTWDAQLREARAYKADNTTDVPMLTGIANGRGITVSDQADRVIAKTQEYTTAVSVAVGKRQNLQADIDAATTVEEVQNILWD